MGVATRIAIHGAAGRMGLRLVALGHESDAIQVVGAIDSPGHPQLGCDVGILAGVGAISVPLEDSLAAPADVVIDFSVPTATRSGVPQWVKAGSRILIGTTGLTAEDQVLLDEMAQRVAVLQAANMSLGVNILMALSSQVAQQLGDDYDIEIVESHHRFKQDAPSGTALALAESICGATGKSLEQTAVYGRHGDQVPRSVGQIGIHAIRSGDLAGRHTVSFGTLGEELQLSHTATTRDVFVHGALRTAVWLASKPAGRYTMRDMLGL